MRRPMVRWGAVALWAAVIFGMSSMRGSTLPGGYSAQAHFGEYFILAALLFLALRPGRPAGRALLLAILIASAYGVTDELHQSFVPLRTPDPLDWLVDTLGAAAGATLAWAIDRARTRPAN